MIALHDGRPEAGEARRLGRALRRLAREARRAPAEAPLLRDALQEGVEALLLHAAETGGPAPGPEALGVDAEEYLLGVGDLVGEIRRRALRALVRGDLAGAEASVRSMEGLYQTLMRFDTSRAIVPLKPKQDAARSLLERTRADVVLARVHARYRAGPAAMDPPAEGP
ncbi:MAG: haloacid dehalogenase [Thermoplasmata archaeon]